MSEFNCTYCLIVTALLGISVALFLLKLYFRHTRYSKPAVLFGKVIVITGANSGIGMATAVDFAKRGAKIYIACRDKKRGEIARQEIQDNGCSLRIRFIQCDLASLDSIREFSREFHELEDKLDILINNAGVMACPRMETKDGFEMHMGVNHLGHFLLTHLLLDLLKAAAPSRIINVSSYAHKLVSNIDRDDLMGEKYYNRWLAYGQSKLANILFTRALAKKLQGTKVTVNCCHPGTVRTQLGRHMNQIFLNYFVYLFFGSFFKTIYQGAQTQLNLAVDEDLEKVTGKYYSNCIEVSPSKAAQDDETAEWLYTKSMELVGL